VRTRPHDLSLLGRGIRPGDDLCDSQPTKQRRPRGEQGKLAFVSQDVKGDREAAAKPLTADRSSPRSLFRFRNVRDGRPAGARHNVRSQVCQLAVDAAVRTFLLAALSILLPEEHPVLLPLPGKVTNLTYSRVRSHCSGVPDPYIMHLRG